MEIDVTTPDVQVMPVQPLQGLVVSAHMRSKELFHVLYMDWKAVLSELAVEVAVNSERIEGQAHAHTHNHKCLHKFLSGTPLSGHEAASTRESTTKRMDQVLQGRREMVEYLDNAHGNNPHPIMNVEDFCIAGVKLSHGTCG